jgi:phenylacetate-coenzyme A ligase PaaK-like adenylate-forming protein
MDISIDIMDEQKRDELLLEKAIKSALFAKENVPFYIKHLEHLSKKNIETISSLEEFAFVIPETTRAHLSFNKHSDFMPIHKNKIIMDKATGGTTNNAVTMCFTKEDWDVISTAGARTIFYDFQDNLKELEDLKVFGLYHGDHITNHFFRTAFEKLNIEFFDRISTKNLIDINYKFFKESNSNAILAPPGSVSHKGLSLSDFFKYDAKYLNEYNKKYTHPYFPTNKADLKAVFWSSANLDKTLLDYMKNHLEIPYIKSIYGSTEAAPVGSNCKFLDFSFHIDYLPHLTLLKKNKSLAKDNEEGYLVVSKIGYTNHCASVLLNYRNGDKALYSKTKCKCKRTSPILHNIQRVEDVDIKAIFGCEVD